MLPAEQVGWMFHRVCIKEASTWMPPFEIERCWNRGKASFCKLAHTEFPLKVTLGALSLSHEMETYCVFQMGLDRCGWMGIVSVYPFFPMHFWCPSISSSFQHQHRERLLSSKWRNLKTSGSSKYFSLQRHPLAKVQQFYLVSLSQVFLWFCSPALILSQKSIYLPFIIFVVQINTFDALPGIMPRWDLSSEILHTSHTTSILPKVFSA